MGRVVGREGGARDSLLQVSLSLYREEGCVGSREEAGGLGSRKILLGNPTVVQGDAHELTGKIRPTLALNPNPRCL